MRRVQLAYYLGVLAFLHVLILLDSLHIDTFVHCSNINKASKP